MRKILVVILGLLVAGCAFERAEVRSSTVDQQLQAPKPTYANGSIWQASSSGFAEDLKARKIGDILTVVIVESASASKQATTDTKRSSSASAGVPNLLGLENTVKSWADLSKLLNASAATTFGGSGATTRKESLNATISAKVIEVLPNGNLNIEGQRNVRVNNEDQVIILEGTVRPRDITADNLINSSLIADARITYGGKGIISDRQKPGWLMNVVDKVWPF